MCTDWEALCAATLRFAGDDIAASTTGQSMSDLQKILWTGASTIIGGTLVFVTGQVVSRFVIDPWHKQRGVIWSIAEALLNYAHLFADSGNDRPSTEAARRLGALSSELLATTVAIPGYFMLAALRLVPHWSDIKRASSGLVGLSNTLNSSDWIQKTKLASQVATSLRIDRIDPTFSQEFADSLAEERRSN